MEISTISGVFGNCAAEHHARDLDLTNLFSLDPRIVEQNPTGDDVKALVLARASDIQTHAQPRGSRILQSRVYLQSACREATTILLQLLAVERGTSVTANW